MTRSGLASAMLWATWANGQSVGLLQSWNLPPASASLISPSFAAVFADLRRQPVSPKAAIDFKAAFGRGRGEFSRLAEVAPAGIVRSQTRTGKVASGTARTLMGCCAPSMVISGQLLACASTARATAPCGPSTTYAASSFGDCASAEPGAHTAASTSAAAASLHPRRSVRAGTTAAMRCFSISNLIGDSEVDDCRETRGDHHGVAQRSPPCRALVPYHGVDPLPIKRKRP